MFAHEDKTGILVEMPPRKKNPLIILAKKIPAAIDNFAVAYDASSDKEELFKTLGDVHALRRRNLDLFSRMTYAIGVDQRVVEETEQHIRLYHSTQNGVNKITDNPRIDALVHFLTCKYVDVSCSFF